MKKISVYILLIVIALSSLNSCIKKKAVITEDTSLIKTIISMDQLKEIIDNAGTNLLIFDLYADWCGPCRLLSPTLLDLAKAYPNGATFYKVNIDKSPYIAASFGVRGIPYVIFVKDKQAIHTLTGLNPRENYEKIITSCGSTVSSPVCQNNLQQL